MRRAIATLLLLTMATTTEYLDRLTASAAVPIALAYGRHVVAGNVILRDDQAGSSIIFIALGEGEWDSVESLLFNGLALDAAKYHFHPGKDGATGTGGVSGDQKIDLWFPGTMTGLTFSRTAYIAINADDVIYSPSDDYSIIGIYRTRKVRSYDAAGVELAYAYSSNPAWCILDALFLSGEGLARIDYASFAAAAAYYAATLTIDGVNYPRFDCHFAWPQQADLGRVIEQMLAGCRSTLFDDGGLIHLRADQNTASVFTFDNGNVVKGSFRYFNRDTSSAPNRLRVEFRDLENNFRPNSILIEREWHQELIGRVIEKKIDIGNSYQQQARRLGEYYTRRAVDAAAMVSLKGMQDSVLLLPGDPVNVSHVEAPWNGEKKFEVIEISEGAREEREALLQEYDVLSFTDTAEPRQLVENGVIVSPATVPAGQVTNLQASEQKYISPTSGGGDGTIWAEITGSWDEPSPLGTYAKGRIYARLLDAVLAPAESWRSIGTFEDSPARFLEPPSAIYVATGDTLEIALVSINTSGRENALDTAPTTTVELDGLPDAPVAVSIFYCQTHLAGGLRLSWAPNLESNLARYRIASTGNIAAGDNADIKDVHIIHTEAQRRDTDQHIWWDFWEEEHEGDSDGTVLTPTSLVLKVDGSDKQLIVDGVGRLVTIQTSIGDTSEHQVVDHTTAAITFASGSIPVGRVKFMLRGLAGDWNFYICAENSSEQRSVWKPIPPATLECVPWARDGSTDIGPPACVKTLTSSAASYFTSGPAGTLATFGSAIAGALGIVAVAGAEPEAETDFTLARMLSIRGVVAWQVLIGYTENIDTRQAVTSISTATPAVVTTPASHGLSPGDWVAMDHAGVLGAGDAQGSVNGLWEVLTTPTGTTFTLKDSHADNTKHTGALTCAAVQLKRVSLAATNTPENYAYATDDSIDRWTLRNIHPVMDLPDAAVYGVSLQARNARGNGPVLRLPAAIVGIGRPPIYTGSNGALTPPVQVTPAGANYEPNLSVASGFHVTLAGNLTIDAPGNLDMDGNSISVLRQGQLLFIILDQPATGTPFTVTFNSIYKGVENYNVEMTLKWRTIFSFLILSTSEVTIQGPPAKYQYVA